MTKPLEGSKEVDRIIDWQIDLLVREAILQNPHEAEKLNITSEMVVDAKSKARARLEAHVKAEIRKTLERLKEQALSHYTDHGIDKVVALSAIDNEIKELEER